MPFHAQRQHVVQSLDSLVYTLSVYSYFLDPSILRLIFRALSQFQFARPAEIDPSRTLRFFAVCCVIVNLSTLSRWIISWLAPQLNWDVVQDKGILLDFVGRGSRPDYNQVLFVDMSIFVLQLVTLIIAYEIGHERTDGPDNLASSTSPEASSYTHLHEEIVDNDDDSEESPSLPKPPTPSLTNDPILTLHLRATLLRILRPPPPPAPSELPLPNSFVTSSSTPVTALRALLLARRRTARAQTETGVTTTTSTSVSREGGDGTGEERGIGRIPGAMPPSG
ncbi:hypothetical protein BOTBODRAFT_36336 [Botryobasidium botryosum FD-172 SS1]|uniref:DUF1746 domain-containing protein n=1 Tax=Botryobasidium botryosum (strain FD-172 SS1) TaxID=930990 RepID=A0A067MEA8_BOTB1|nr:hypothetical protein BOTBODRAFT_36336 [Botryobasidium botryosum FD-172 SS1]